MYVIWMWQSMHASGKHDAEASQPVQEQLDMHTACTLMPYRSAEGCAVAGGLARLCRLRHGHQEMASQPCRCHRNAEVSFYCTLPEQPSVQQVGRPPLAVKIQLQGQVGPC